MPSTQVYLTPEQDEIIKEISNNKNLTKSDIIQNLINEGLNKHKRKK